MKTTFKYNNGKIEKKEKPKAKQVHGVVQDTLLEPVESMATPNREMFDSMSAYKRHLKEHGKEITGGDHLTGKSVDSYRYKADRQAINDNLREAHRLNKWGMAPLSEEDRARCKKEAKAYNRLKLEKRYRLKRFWRLKLQNQNNQQTTEA